MSAKKEIIKIIESMAGRYFAYEIFSDWIHMSALAISNTTHLLHDRIWKAREEEYKDIQKKYSGAEMEQMGALFALLTDALEEEITDVLGEVYMESGMGSKSAGQFFTPFHLSELCARMDLNTEDLKNSAELVELNEPTCGGGGMIIAAAKVMHDAGINYQKRLRAVAQDVDWKGVYMTYLQCSLLGIRAIVVQGNTLMEPYVHGYDRGRVFYTPAEMGMLV